MTAKEKMIEDILKKLNGNGWTKEELERMSMLDIGTIHKFICG